MFPYFSQPRGYRYLRIDGGVIVRVRESGRRCASSWGRRTSLALPLAGSFKLKRFRLIKSDRRSKWRGLVSIGWKELSSFAPFLVILWSIETVFSPLYKRSAPFNRGARQANLPRAHKRYITLMPYHPSPDNRDYSSIALSQAGKTVDFQYRCQQSRFMGDLPQYIHSYGILQVWVLFSSWSGDSYHLSLLYGHEIWGCNPRMGPKLTEASAWYVIAAFNAVRQIRPWEDTDEA